MAASSATSRATSGRLVRGSRVSASARAATFGSGGRSAPREDYHGVSIQTFRDGLIVHDDAFWVPGA